MNDTNNTNMTFIGAKVPAALLERIKDAARQRAIQQRRHVPYVELLREALMQAFPEPGQPNGNAVDTGQPQNV